MLGGGGEHSCRRQERGGSALRDHVKKRASTSVKQSIKWTNGVDFLFDLSSRTFH